MISRLTVHAFTPEDAYAISSKLLRMGEGRINALVSELQEAARLLAQLPVIDRITVPAF